MSTTIEYKCNFCNEIIVPKATDFGAQGFCCARMSLNIVFSTDLKINVDGPHICRKCVDRINKIILEK